MDLSLIKIAVLCETVNKYRPGVHSFYITSLMPLVSQSNIDTTVPNVVNNIVNDKTTKPKIVTSNISTSSTVSLYLPKEHTRWYPTKYIPAGTKFVATFTDGDINKLKIVGRL